jgi:hypothetical protein
LNYSKSSFSEDASVNIIFRHNFLHPFPIVIDLNCIPGQYSWNLILKVLSILDYTLIHRFKEAGCIWRYITCSNSSSLRRHLGFK